MQCDNTVSVAAMNLSRITDKFAQAIMREVAYWCAVFEIEVLTHHVEGYTNEVADALSRWHLSDDHEKRFYSLVDKNVFTETIIDPSIFRFTSKWC